MEGNFGCFGKLPIHSDFIRYQASSIEVRMLDLWFQEGIHFSRSHLGRDWDEAFSNAGPWNFIFHSGRSSDAFLVGVFIPSRDRSGRAYPFFLFLRVNKSSFGGPLYFAPLCFSPFLQEAQRIVKTGWQGVDLKGFLAKMAQVTIPLPLDFGKIREAYLSTLDRLSNRQFWTDLFGDFGNPRKYQLSENLLNILAPLHDYASSQLRWGLNFPLILQDRLDDGKEGHDIPFWFDIVFHQLKEEEAPVFFWKRNPAKGMPRMMAFFCPPSPKNFLSLICPDLENDAWYNLVSGEGLDRDRFSHPIGENRKALLDNAEISMGTFLKTIDSIR